MSIKFCNFTVSKYYNTKVMYKRYNSNENLIFPPNLGDFIPQDAPIRLVAEIVERLDLREVHESYSMLSSVATPT